MTALSVPDLSVSDLLSGDPDLVWISRWVPLDITERVIGYTGVSQRPAEMPLALFGWGVGSRFTAKGSERLAALGGQWRAWASAWGRSDPWHAFVASTFADDSQAESVLIVPRVLALQYAHHTEFLTLDRSLLDELLPRLGVAGLGGGPPSVTVHPGRLTPQGYADAVREALRIIENGQCAKIVLSRDVVVEAEQLRVADLLARLRRQSPDTWVFSIDGLVGATPELLGGAHDRRFYARVLAGSASPDQSDWLWTSVKNQSEHAFAVASVAETIEPLLDLFQHPTVVLRLPDIAHLSTELTADLHPGVDLLQVVEAMHPTAAICGTPTAVAARRLAEIEGFDRGRYGGPVGWVDAAGGGELALALRCGQLESADGGRRIRLFAGAGIVEGSDPDAEVAETDHKLRPMLKALGIDGPVR